MLASWLTGGGTPQSPSAQPCNPRDPPLRLSDYTKRVICEYCEKHVIGTMDASAKIHLRPVLREVVVTVLEVGSNTLN